MHVYPTNSSRFESADFAFRYDWWRRLQPTSSVSPVWQLFEVVLAASRKMHQLVSRYPFRNWFISHAFYDVYTHLYGHFWIYFDLVYAKHVHIHGNTSNSNYIQSIKDIFEKKSTSLQTGPVVSNNHAETLKWSNMNAMPISQIILFMLT